MTSSSVEGERFFAVSTTPTAIIDASGRIDRVNAAWKVFFGEPAAAEKLVDRARATDRPRLERAVGELVAGTPSNPNARFVVRSGNEAEVSLELSGSADVGFFCAARPVKTPPLDEKRSDLLACLIRPLDETDMIGICLVSRVVNRPVYANATAGKIWQIPDLVERVANGSIDNEEMRRAFLRAVADPQALADVEREILTENGRREFELALRDGRSVLFVVIPANDELGHRMGSLFIVRDITKRKAIEEALARTLERLETSEGEFRTLLELIPAGISVMRDGVVAYVNQAAARIYGCDGPEDMIGVHVSALVQPEDLPESIERLRHMTGEAVPSQARRFMRRDGSVGYITTQGFPIEYEGGTATLIVVNDLTEQRRIEAKMRQAERLASLGMLSAAIAHEINNPLAYILLNLQATRRWLGQALAAESIAALSNALELIDQSLEGVERVRVIVRDLRAFAHADDSENALVDVRSVIESILPIAEHEIRDRATLVKAFGEVPIVRANAARLGQVFLNLLVNAAHAIPPGEEGHEIRISVSAESAQKVIVAVEDTGEGMPPSVRDRVFEPFFTTKAAGIGTGLGLALCQGIVQALGGDIAVDSRVGAGSTFRVSLPVAVPGPRETIQPAAVVVPRSKILVVDDEPRIANRLAELLRDHEVVVATTGTEAIERLARESFDAVFCDLMMPDVKGTDVFEAATRDRPALRGRFVFMTAGAFTPGARELLDRVSTVRLDKPFTETQVQHVLSLVVTARKEDA